jgi:hypothetical protein
MCRSTYSPKHLVTTFEPPGESIGTLYDNFENAAARSPNVRSLAPYPASTAPACTCSTPSGQSAGASNLCLCWLHKHTWTSRAWHRLVLVAGAEPSHAPDITSGAGMQHTHLHRECRSRTSARARAASAARSARTRGSRSRRSASGGARSAPGCSLAACPPPPLSASLASTRRTGCALRSAARSTDAALPHGASASRSCFRAPVRRAQGPRRHRLLKRRNHACGHRTAT